MRRKPYPSDLTDVEWKGIVHLVPKPKLGGRRPKSSRREILNAILYVAREGCTWRALPHDRSPLVWGWSITPASVQDWKGAKEVILWAHPVAPRLVRGYADAADKAVEFWACGCVRVILWGA